MSKLHCLILELPQTKVKTKESRFEYCFKNASQMWQSIYYMNNRKPLSKKTKINLNTKNMLVPIWTSKIKFFHCFNRCRNKNFTFISKAQLLDFFIYNIFIFFLLLLWFFFFNDLFVMRGWAVPARVVAFSKSFGQVNCIRMNGCCNLKIKNEKLFFGDLVNAVYYINCERQFKCSLLTEAYFSWFTMTR